MTNPYVESTPPDRMAYFVISTTGASIASIALMAIGFMESTSSCPLDLAIHCSLEKVAYAQLTRLMEQATTGHWGNPVVASARRTRVPACAR